MNETKSFGSVEPMRWVESVGWIERSEAHHKDRLPQSSLWRTRSDSQVAHLPLSANGSPISARLLAACDVRVRFTVALAAVVAVVMSTRLWFGPAAFAGCLLLAALARSPLAMLARRLAAPLVLALFVALLRTFSGGGEPLWQLDLGRWQLVVGREGLAAGLLIAGRVLGSCGIVIVFCQGTPAREILAAMRWARVPRTWLEVALLMERYLHVLYEQAASVTAAQKVRLGYAAWGRSIRSLGSLAGIILLRSLDQVEKSHEAMVARGYQGRWPLSSLAPLQWEQKVAAALGVALVATAFLLAQRCPW